MNETATQAPYDSSLEDTVIAPSFENATEGTVPAVLVDVVPIGLVDQKDEKTGITKQVFKINLVFQIEEENSKGYRFTIRRRLTLSLNEKATFRPFYEALNGRAVTTEEENGKTKITVKSLFSLIGKSVLIGIKRSPDGKYDNISTVMGLPKGVNPVKAQGYTRVKDR